jgi:hypothetical protein
MNHKRGFLAFIVAFALMFLFGFVWHGMLMKPMYVATASLWRAQTDFNSHFPILILGHAIVAFAFTGLYVSKVGINSAGIGFGYGIVVGILACSINVIRFAVEPAHHKHFVHVVRGRSDFLRNHGRARRCDLQTPKHGLIEI